MRDRRYTVLQHDPDGSWFVVGSVATKKAARLLAQQSSDAWQDDAQVRRDGATVLYVEAPHA